MANTIRVNGQLAEVKYGASFIECNLNEVTLNGIDFNGVDLTMARICDKDLTTVSLKGANLNAAELCSSNLSELDLSHTNLEGADLYKANLDGTNLSYSNLRRAHFYEAHLEHADLSHADLSGADFSYSNLCRVNLFGANITSVDFQGSNTRKTSFYKTVMYGKVVNTLRVFTGIYEYEVQAILFEDGERWVKMGKFCQSIEQWDKAGILSYKGITEYPNQPIERVAAFEYAKAAALRLEAVTEWPQ